jgi:uncharacterized membrane protein
MDFKSLKDKALSYLATFGYGFIALVIVVLIAGLALKLNSDGSYIAPVSKTIANILCLFGIFKLGENVQREVTKFFKK